MNLTEAIKQALIERGIIGETWRIRIREITSTAGGTGDAVRVILDIIKPRCRKACAGWELYIDTARNLIWWDRSTHWTN